MAHDGREGYMESIGTLKCKNRFRVVASLAPFSNNVRTMRDYECGNTIRNIIDDMSLSRLGLEFKVQVNGRPLNEDSWFIKPSPGDFVTVNVMPSGGGGGGGGGKPMGRILGAIAVMALAAWGGGALAAGMGLTKGGTLYGIVKTAAVIGAGAAYNKLVPMPSPKLEGSKREPTQYSFTGSSNVVNRYGVVPRLYGKHRIFPPLAGLPYTEIIGDETYIRMAFMFGYGPLDIDADTIKIGDTAISNYENVQMEIREGYATDDDITLYPDTVDELVVGQLLDPDTDYTATTGANTDEVSVVIEFPSGLVVYDSEGNKYSKTVQVEVYERKSGGSWFPDTTDKFPAFGGWTLTNGATIDGSGYLDLPATTDPLNPPTALSPLIDLETCNGFYLDMDWQAWDGSTYQSWYVGDHIRIHWYGLNADDPELIETDEDIRGFDTQITSASYRDIEYESGPNYGQTKFRIEIFNDDRDYDISVKPFTVNLKRIVEVTAATNKRITRGISFAVGDGRGQYDVKVSRITAESTSPDAYEDAYWMLMRSLTNENPLPDIDGKALIALRIRATDQLNGVVETLNCEATSVLRAYNGATWDAAAATQNPAWIYCDILQGTANNSGVADARLDLTAIKTWADDCDTEGYEFNAVFDTPTTIFEALKAVAAVGRASPTFTEGLFSVVQDKEQTTPAQVLTPRNSWDFSGSKVFTDELHALRVRFLNKDADYQEDERWVYNDGYDEDTATAYETVEFWGITDPDQIWKAGRYLLAVQQLRPEVYTCKMDIENLVCQRGDLVLANHDIPLWGVGYGIVMSVSSVPAGPEVTIDNEVTMVTGNNYVIQYRKDDGTVQVYDVFNDNTTTDTIRINDTGVVDDPEEGDVVLFGVLDAQSTELIVKEILPSSDLTATLVLVDHSPAIFDADTGTIPDFDSNITVPYKPEKMVPPPVTIDSIVSDETVLVRDVDGSLTSRILLHYSYPIGSQYALPDYAQVRYRIMDEDVNYTTLPPSPCTSREFSVMPVNDGSIYELSIRLVSAYGLTGPWTHTEHTVIGKTTLPPDVETLYIKNGILDWVYESPPNDFAGFKVRYNYGTNTTWSEGIAAHAGLVADTQFDTKDNIVHGNVTLMVKAVDTSGNESENAATLVKDIGAPEEVNIVTTTDLDATSYPGIKLNGRVTGSTLAADGTSYFWGEDDELFWGDDGDLFWDGDYYQMVYICDLTPVAADLPSRLWFDYTTSGLASIRFRFATEVETDDFNRASLGSDWTQTAGSGTWDILSSTLLRVQTTGTDERLAYKTDIPENTEAFVQMTVASADGTGLRLCGSTYTYHSSTGTWKIDGVETDITPSSFSATNLWHVRADGIIDWYIDSEYIGSGEYSDDTDNVEVYAEVASATCIYDDFELRIAGDEWSRWSGELGLYDEDADELIEVKFTFGSGQTQGTMTKCEAYLDVPDIHEQFDDVSIGSGGTRLSLAETYRDIVHVVLTVQDDGGSAVGAYVGDKNHTSGPLIYCVAQDGTQVAGTIDADVYGY